MSARDVRLILIRPDGEGLVCRRYLNGKRDTAVRMDGDFEPGDLAKTIEAFRWNGLQGLSLMHDVKDSA